MNLKLSMETAVAEAAGRTRIDDPGPKPDDRAGEQVARHRALADLGAALAVEAEARAAGAEGAARRAEAAVWLGASLADLGGVTGRSRQAARKRWPDLGTIQRRRRWLGHHVDEVLWAARLVLGAADDLEGVDPGARDALAGAVERAERDFGGERRDGRGLAPGAVPSTGDAPVDLDLAVARWQSMDTLVDTHLRGMLAGVPDEPADPTAGFAAHGARGVLSYYDHAVHEADDPTEAGST